MACSSSTSPWVLLRTMWSHESEGRSASAEWATPGRWIRPAKRRPAAGSWPCDAARSIPECRRQELRGRHPARGFRLEPAMRKANVWVREYAGPTPSLQAVDTAVNAFRGTFPQQPPAFSAKKIGGRRSYKIARAASRAARSGGDGQPDGPLPSAVEVTAHQIDVRSIDGSVVALRLICSAGFYVRALAHDLGERLGTGGHLIALRRTASGEFTLLQAVTLDLVERDPRAALASVIPLVRASPGVLLGDTDGGGRETRPSRPRSRAERLCR